MALISKKHYVVNDNYSNDLTTYFDMSYPDKLLYQQVGSTGDANIIFFKENNLPINDVFPDAPGIAYPVGYVGDTLHPAVDGSNQYVITMASTIDMDRHPKFYVADNINELLVALRKIFQNVSIAGLTTTQARKLLLTELHGPGNGYLTYDNILHTGAPFPSYSSDNTYINPALVVDPYFIDCWDRSSNEFYDISYSNHSFFTSPNGVPTINRFGCFTRLDTNPIINIDHFNTVSPITTTGSTMAIEFWARGVDQTGSVNIPAFIRGWSSGTISCGVTINDGTIYAYSNGVEVQVSLTNIINDAGWHHVFVSYEQISGGIGIKTYIDGQDMTFGGIPVIGNAVVGTHQETASIGCYTPDGSSIDVTKTTFGSVHEIAMIRFYDNDSISLNGQVDSLYKASYDRFYYF